MADNVNANSGDGLGPKFLNPETSFGGDTGYCPLVVPGIITGAEGSRTFTLFVAGAGAVDGGTQRVTHASDDPVVTALQIMDDWDETDRAKVNLIAGQAGITAGAGAVAASTPRVTLASDDPGVAHLAVIATAFNGVASPAHDAVDSGDPIKVGFKAVAGLSGLTMVAAADRSDAFAGLDGAQIIRAHCCLEDIVSGNASNTDGVSTEVIATAGAGIKQYLTRVTLTNTSTTMRYVELKSGTTVKHTVPVPAEGGATIGFDPPLPPNAANEAWNFDPSAATTTMYCSMVGFKSKI